MKRKSLKQRYILVEYFFISSMLIPSLASAENGGVMSGDSLAILLVFFSTLFALGHLSIVTLMRLGNYFKHLWLLRISIFLNVISGFLWIVSVVSLITYENEFDRHNFTYFIVLSVISIISLFLIIWSSKIPLRQYRGKDPGRKIPAGIVIISIYTIFSGVIYLSGQLSSQLSSQLFMLLNTNPSIDIDYIHSLLYLLSKGSILYGILFFASIYGLWSLKRWGWFFALWLYVFSIPLQIISVLPIYQNFEMTNAIGHTLFQLFYIAVTVTVIYYLKKDKIKNLYDV